MAEREKRKYKGNIEPISQSEETEDTILLDEERTTDVFKKTSVPKKKADFVLPINNNTNNTEENDEEIKEQKGTNKNYIFIGGIAGYYLSNVLFIFLSMFWNNIYFYIICVLIGLLMGCVIGLCFMKYNQGKHN